MATFSWILYPHNEYLPVLADEFIVSHFRLKLRGNSIQVEVEAPASGGAVVEARKLAESYPPLTKQLSLATPLRLVTIEEFGCMPLPGTITTSRGLTREQHQRGQEAIRRARGELLASEDETLRRCYDYIQNAREQPKESLSYHYKAVEAIENVLGGQREATKKLGIGIDLEFVKRLSNEPLRDERHAPRTGDTIKPAETAEKGRAFES